MTRQRNVVVATLGLMMSLPCPMVRGEDEEAMALRRLMPADAALTAVVVNLERFDQALSVWGKLLDSDQVGPGLLDGIRADLKIGEWVDFTKPLGAAVLDWGDRQAPVLWLCVPDFATKVRALAGAEEDAGVWHLVFDGGGDFYVKPAGDYVVAAASKAMLDRATKGGRSLADALASRSELFHGRDAFVHINMGFLRETVLGGLAQLRELSPMLALAVTQRGTDAHPETASALFNRFFGACRRTVEQVAYIDIAVNLSEKVADLTLATGFGEGPIKSYLARQKPAAVSPLTHIENQPYFLAVSSHFPGKQSQVLEYILEQMLDAMTTAPRPVAGDAPLSDNTAGGEDAAQELRQLLDELYRQLEGGDVLMALGPDGMKILGDYFGQDSAAIMALVRRFVTGGNPLAARLKGGVSYKALGSRKIGDVVVENYAMKVDPSNPAGRLLAAFYGEEMRFAIGEVDSRVRYCIGNEDDIKRAFSGTVTWPMASSRYASAALAALPARQNVVALIDLAGVSSLLAPMAARRLTDPIPPGPPIALSASFAGEPARLDVHIPIRAIERVTGAMSPPQPVKPATEDTTGVVP